MYRQLGHPYQVYLLFHSHLLQAMLRNSGRKKDVVGEIEEGGGLYIG